MPTRWLVGLCAVLLAVAGAAVADEKADDKAERARIEASFKADLAACQSRFVVTACVDEAKQRRRDALAPVRLRELQLDAVERQRRASERLVQTQRKQEEAARRPADGASAARPARPARAVAPSASHAAASQPLAVAPDTSAKKEEYARREQAFQAHREQVEQRNAERNQRRPRAAPLPVPASSAAASAAGR